jgi:hypothetical protein
LRAVLFGFVVIMIVGFILRMTAAMTLGRFFIAFGTTFLVVFLVLLVFRGPAMAWKRDPTLASSQSVTITNQEVVVTTSDRTIKLDWQRLSSAIELQKGFFFVFTGPPTVVLLPKRAIGADQDLTFVRGFVPKPFIRISRI